MQQLNSLKQEPWRCSVEYCGPTSFRCCIRLAKTWDQPHESLTGARSHFWLCHASTLPSFYLGMPACLMARTSTTPARALLELRSHGQIYDICVKWVLSVAAWLDTEGLSLSEILFDLSPGSAGWSDFVMQLSSLRRFCVAALCASAPVSRLQRSHSCLLLQAPAGLFVDV